MALSSYRIPFLIPYFVEMQRQSFLNFLNTGLSTELSKKNPIYDSFREFKMSFYPKYYQLSLPDYTPKTALLKFKTYSSKIYIPIRYTNYQTKQSKLQWIILANLPLMTKRGNFIINGSPRIIVNQIVRSPGIYYKKVIDQKKREIYYADLISQRGAWLRFEIDKKKRIWIQMKKTRKIPILIFFKALGISNFQIKETIKYSKFLENSKFLTEEIEKEDYIHPKTLKDSLIWIYTFVYPQKKKTGHITKTFLKKAKKFLFRKFFSYRTYDLGYSGRIQLNKKFNISFSNKAKKTFILTNQDFLFAIDYLIKVEKNISFIDDIDHLKNRRVRTSGELIQNQFGTGLIRLEKIITDKTQDLNIFIEDIFTPKSVDSALREFFGSSPLSQFMDQTNPLAELTHKRRVSSLGPGGVTRETAGMDVRGIHPSHYGRICPIETPEGKNAGLVNSLTTLAKINDYGFIETPFYNIYKKQVQKWKSAAYFSPTEEQFISIAPGDIKLNYFLFLCKNTIFAKYDNEFKKVHINQIEYMCVSVIQIISIATSLIPFLEHDDANRALMGSNMQRQAVPLILPERPTIGTGLENKIVSDSGHGVQSKKSGKVLTINSKNIMVTNLQSHNTKTIYNKYINKLNNFKKSYSGATKLNYKNLNYLKTNLQRNFTILPSFQANLSKNTKIKEKQSRILQKKNRFFIEASMKPYNYLYKYKNTKSKPRCFFFPYTYNLIKKNICTPKTYTIYNPRLLFFIFTYFLNINYKKILYKQTNTKFQPNLSVNKSSDEPMRAYFFPIKNKQNLTEQNFILNLLTKQNFTAKKTRDFPIDFFLNVEQNSFYNLKFHKRLFCNFKKNFSKKFFQKVLKNLGENQSFTDQNLVINNQQNFNKNLQRSFANFPSEAENLFRNLPYLFFPKVNKYYLLNNKKKNKKFVEKSQILQLTKLRFKKNNTFFKFKLFNEKVRILKSKLIFENILVYNIKQIIQIFLYQYIKLIFFQNFIEKKNIKHIFFYRSLNWQNFNIQKFNKTRYFNKNSIQVAHFSGINFFKNPNFLGHSNCWFNTISRSSKNLKKNKSYENNWQLNYKQINNFPIDFSKKKLKSNCTKIKKFKNFVFELYIKKKSKEKFNIFQSKKQNTLYFPNIILINNKLIINSQKLYFHLNFKNNLLFLSNVKLKNIISPLFKNKIFLVILKIQKKFLLEKLNKYFVSILYSKQLYNTKVLISEINNVQIMISKKTIKKSLWVSNNIMFNFNICYKKPQVFSVKTKQSLPKLNFILIKRKQSFLVTSFGKKIYDFFPKQDFAEQNFLYTGTNWLAFQKQGFENKIINLFLKQHIHKNVAEFNLNLTSKFNCNLNSRFFAKSYFSNKKEKSPSFKLFKYQNRIENFNLKSQFMYLDKIVNYSLLNYNHSNQNTCLNQTPLVSSGEWVQKGDLLADGAASAGSELALGKSILVAYMPWEGYNFEDAILINERLIYDDLYTSIHIEKYKTEVYDTQYGPEKITTNIPHVLYKQKLNLDANGIIKIGSWVSAGDILVGKVTPIQKKNFSGHAKLLADILEKKNYIYTVRDTSLRVPKHVSGRIVHIEQIENEKVLFKTKKNRKLNSFKNFKRIQIYIAEKRKIQVGDKMSGRHGNKGIISNILPRQDMPYLSDGTPIDMVLNPLGVPSRMNVGQIFECLLGLAANELHEHIRMSIFDEMSGAETTRSLAYSKLFNARLKTGKQWLFNPISPGKMTLFDGRTGECFKQNNTVGTAYMLKLVHLVDEKIHARSTGPYSLVTQQPVRGRSKHGGQRLGEMEVWALEGFGAAYTLQELLTSKSDDIKSRYQIMQSILERKYILRYTPESFKVLLSELQSLCLNIGVYGIDTCGTRKKVDIMQLY